MSGLVARTGRHQQRYDAGCRLVAGCIIYIYQKINFPDSRMSELVARTGRDKQRYEAGCRLVAGCIPYRYQCAEGDSCDSSGKIVEVLMINSTSGPGLLFPKGGWENDETVEEAAEREALEEAGVRGDLMHYLGDYLFNSKTIQDGLTTEGLCKATMFALLVKEELEAWPEMSHRRRSWLTIPEAMENCRHPWMRKALIEGFSKWHADGMISTMKDYNTKTGAKTNLLTPLLPASAPGGNL